MLTQIPYPIFRKAVGALGGSLTRDEDLAVGVFFLPADERAAQDQIKAAAGEVAARRHLPRCCLDLILRGPLVGRQKEDAHREILVAGEAAPQCADRLAENRVGDLGQHPEPSPVFMSASTAPRWVMLQTEVIAKSRVS